MTRIFCPNYQTCKLTTEEHFIQDPRKKLRYLEKYCESPVENWNTCKRYVMKHAVHFCPDFVLPDTPLSPEEIIDRFEELETES